MPEQNLLHERSKRQSTRSQKWIVLYVMCVIGAFLRAVVFLFAPGSWQGGAIGKYIDERERRRYLEGRKKLNVQFPKVVLRSNRAVVPGYSRYLEEILERFPKGIDGDIISREQEPLSISFVAVSVELKEETGNLGNEVVVNKLGKCNLGWFCQRCLSSPQLGTIASCGAKCPNCLSESYCQGQDNAFPKTIISVKRKYDSKDCRIPRIVHQMWLEPVDSLKNPELARIQNAWRASDGYKYKFYTLESARDYVAKHYPRTILVAFDFIAPQRAKLEFFQLLVLFKDGGVYADIDLVLETNLRTLIPPKVAFVGVRSDSHMDYCLSMSFLACEPGNELIGSAIERTTNAVLLGKDHRGVEARVCQGYHHHAPIWKLRMAPAEENIVGGCALGMAVNVGLGRNELDDFQPSLRADGLILALSKDDAGAARISDIDRNILVASAGVLGLTTVEVPRRRAVQYHGTRCHNLDKTSEFVLRTKEDLPSGTTSPMSFAYDKV